MSTKSEPLDVRKLTVVRAIKFDRPRRACLYDPAGRYLFSGGEDYFIQRWDRKTNQIDKLAGHESWVMSFACPTPSQLISGGYDGRLIWWNLTGKKPAVSKSIEAHQGWIRSIALSPNRKMVATVGNDHLVKVWDVQSHRQIRALYGHKSHVYSTAFHPSGDFLVSADHKGIIRQWDTKSWKDVRQLDASPLYTWNKGYRAAAGGVRSMDFSEDGRWLAGCGLTNATDTFGQVVHPAVALFDWKSGKRVRLQLGKGEELGVAWGVTFHPSNQFHSAVCGGRGRGGQLMYFFNKKTDKPFHTLSISAAARDLAMHPSGKEFAVAQIDNLIRIVGLM